MHLVLGVDGCVQGNGLHVVLPLTRRQYRAFAMKAAAWHTAQASGDGDRRPLVTLRKKYRN